MRDQHPNSAAATAARPAASPGCRRLVDRHQGIEDLPVDGVADALHRAVTEQDVGDAGMVTVDSRRGRSARDPLPGLPKLTIVCVSMSRGSIQLMPAPSHSATMMVLDGPSLMSSGVGRGAVGDAVRSDEHGVTGLRAAGPRLARTTVDPGICWASAALCGLSHGSSKRYCAVKALSLQVRQDQHPPTVHRLAVLVGDEGGRKQPNAWW